jgi:hypothetical protein
MVNHALGCIDRYLVPLDSPRVLRYFTETLLVPHGHVERIRKFVRRPSVRRASEDELGSDTRELLQQIEHALPRSPSALRSIILRDYEGTDRARVMAFLFDGDAPAPFAVAKAQRTPHELRREAEAIESVRAMLPPQLRGAIPEVLAVDTYSRGELLVQSALPGRSSYVDMQSSFAPWRRVEAHLEAASRWLAAFHDATRVNATYPLGDLAIPMSALHGDYWARNVMLNGNSMAVVDWEHFSPVAPPYVDLFHYALTYGLNYPGARYHRLAPEDAFARTFLERNRLSRAVRRYFQDYMQRSGLPPKSLVPAFREFLSTRGTMNITAEPPGTKNVPWKRFAELFGANSADTALQ